jgi:hypothetical protein
VRYVELIGWCGAVLLLLMYWCLASGYLESQARAYHFLNALGASAMLCNALFHQAYPLAALNGTWAVIGLISLTRNIIKSRALQQGRISGGSGSNTQN